MKIEIELICIIFKHLASFRGYLKDGQTVQLLKKIKFEEGLLPYPLLLNVSENILIVSDEYTKEIVEAYKIKRVSKCKCYENDDEIGNIMLLSTRKLKRNTRATHVFKASDELLLMAVEDIVDKQQRTRKRKLLGKWRK
eukprot:Seg2198.3 transcript_id=Seg2198.3/GoldUCD/mRNA.D3Y31 product="hypothetical protein" protein_id=Seg2198.3/GoldUCD/D3Y31